MKEKMRVVHVFGKMNRGGAETLIMNIYRKIDRSKIQFDFIVHTQQKCHYDDEICELGGKIYRVPQLKATNYIEYNKCWKKIFNENKWKVVHGHMYTTASIYLGIAKKMGIKTISHSHSTSNGEGITSKIKNIIQFPVRYIADFRMGCSIEANKWLYGEKKYNNRECYVLNNGIDLEGFKYREEIRKNFREKFNIDDKFVIGHIGRFIDVKNHSFLIDIFKDIYDKDNSAVLMLIGEGSLKEKIEEKVKKLKIEDNVIFTGARSDIPELLQCMDTFILPSKYEGLPLVMIEAQASGLPCYISDTIKDEVKIVDEVYKISINDRAEVWAKKILNGKKERYDGINKLKDAGYDIEKVSKWLVDFYFDKV